MHYLWRDVVTWLLAGWCSVTSTVDETSFDEFARICRSAAATVSWSVTFMSTVDDFYVDSRWSVVWRICAKPFCRSAAATVFVIGDIQRPDFGVSTTLFGFDRKWKVPPIEKRGGKFSPFSPHKMKKNPRPSILSRVTKNVELYNIYASSGWPDWPLRECLLCEVLWKLQK
jgi:hypothetical protein